MYSINRYWEIRYNELSTFELLILLNVLDNEITSQNIGDVRIGNSRKAKLRNDCFLGKNCHQPFRRHESHFAPREGSLFIDLPSNNILS